MIESSLAGSVLNDEPAAEAIVASFQYFTGERVLRKLERGAAMKLAS